jgi:dolichyl-phosphate beta-glucosyltransferase
VSSSRHFRQISIVFPSYNEGRRLSGTLDEVIAYCEREFDQWEVIVVDDGSTDNTAEVVKFRDEVRYICNEVNSGKGETVKRGMLAARLDPILFSDVDLSTPIAETIALLERIEDGADIAIARREMDSDEKIVRRTPLRRFLAWGFRKFVRIVALRGVEDTQCGFKMFRRSVAQEVFPLQKLGGWAFDVEVLFLAQQRGYRIDEVKVEWQESDASTLSFWSPFQMARDILKIRWIHRGDRRVLRAKAQQDASLRVQRDES